MEELINLIVLNAEIPEEAAQKTVETMLIFLKQKLPPSLYNQMELILAGGATRDLSKSFGGLIR